MLIDAEKLATEAFECLTHARQVSSFSARCSGLDLGDAYAVAAAIRRRREERGERPIGRKIGFTNRTIWREYGISAPIWGYMYDRTVHRLADTAGAASLRGLMEPRIEPEIAFKLKTPPRPGMSDEALWACVEWIAHGFEIVHSIFPGWKFSTADTVIAFGLHGAFHYGPTHAADAYSPPALSALEVDLERNDAQIDHGRGEHVLGGPFAALKHLIGVLGRDPFNPPLAAGEVVTTGTLTRAFPVAGGETWSTAIRNAPISGVRLRFV